MLNEVDAVKLREADEDVPAQKLALALLLIDADGRLEQFQGTPWTDLPPMFRWMAHKLLANDELRVRIVKVLRMNDKWPMTG